MKKSQMARPEQALAEAVRQLGQPDFPARLAAFLHGCAAFDNFIVIAYRGEDKPIVLYREFKDAVVYHAMDSEYVAAAYLLDPFFGAHREHYPAGFHRIRDIAPDQFRRTSYFRVYYRKTTLIDEIAALAYTRSGYTITACLGTDRSSGRMFTRAERAALRRYQDVTIALIDSHWRDLAPPGPGRNMAEPVLERLIYAVRDRRDIGLSRRQAQVAMLILQGHSSESIGLALKISAQTVKVFRRQLYARCNISSQAELFAMMMPMLAEASGTVPAGL